MTWRKDDFKTYDQLIDQYEVDGLSPEDAEQAARDDIDWERR